MISEFLKIIHLRIIDTSVIFTHPAGPPFKSSLKYLAQSILRRKIQSNGHDSIVDAVSCMELVHLKIKNGPRFGDATLSEETETIFNLYHRNKRKCVMIDRASVVQLYSQLAINSSTSFIPCISDDEIAEHIIKEIQKTCSTNTTSNSSSSNTQHNSKAVDFIWGQFHDLENYYDNIEMGNSVESINSILSKIDQNIKAIHNSALPNTLIVVTTGKGNSAIINRLQRDIYTARAQESKNTEDAEPLEELDETIEDLQSVKSDTSTTPAKEENPLKQEFITACARARNALSFFKIK